MPIFDHQSSSFGAMQLAAMGAAKEYRELVTAPLGRALGRTPKAMRVAGLSAADEAVLLALRRAARASAPKNEGPGYWETGALTRRPVASDLAAGGVAKPDGG